MKQSRKDQNMSLHRFFQIYPKIHINIKWFFFKKNLIYIWSMLVKPFSIKIWFLENYGKRSKTFIL
jgi:hypothetical protein